jgi:hypothetical protein
MKPWMKQALKKLKNPELAWRAWSEWPDSVYDTYVTKGNDWMYYMSDEDKVWMVLLTIEAEMG